MGRCATLCFLLAALSVRATADTLELENGGKVDGTIDEIVFLQAGEKKTLRAGQFQAVSLSPRGSDTVRLSDGGSLEGELLSLKVKTVGGLIPFKRAQLARIRVAQADLSDRRREYLRRRAAVDKDDAAGLYKLAVWCREHELRAEARDLAALCLKAEPTPEIATLAHRILGHVLEDGRWVDPATVTPPDDEDETPAEPKKGPEPGTGEVDPALARYFTQLCEEYAQKAEKARTEDWEAVKGAYQKDWDRLNLNVKKVREDLESSNKKRIRLRDEIRDELRRGEGGYPDDPETASEQRRKDRIDDLRRQYDRVRNRCERLESSYEKVRKDRLRLAVKIKSAQAKARERAGDREQRLAIAKSRIERLLRLGRPVTEDDIKKAFETALTGD
jgi:hypothetical protein